MRKHRVAIPRKRPKQLSLINASVLSGRGIGKTMLLSFMYGDAILASQAEEEAKMAAYNKNDIRGLAAFWTELDEA